MKSAKSILVVDDDKEDHMILLEYFTDAGLHEQVLFVENGQRALEYLEATDDGELPRLIILDLNMPILNGTQTLLKIKQNAAHKHIPVIVYSTSENETEKRKCLSFGANAYMVKPLTFDDGVEMIRVFASYLNGKEK
jgi:CheY-like chemotaxis protein